MSDTFGTPHGKWAGTAGDLDTVHEAYSFACMNCGHCWEQAYEIAHETDVHGHTTVVYTAAGQRVPSPLTRPLCGNCGGHLIRVMRSGRVSAAARWGRPPAARAAVVTPPPLTVSAPPAGAFAAAGPYPVAGERRHHWLADILSLFHRRPPAVGGQEEERRAA